MVEVQTLIAFVVAVMLLAISPGPDNIFVAVQSARVGFKSALAVIFGLMTGCLLHTSFLAFGFSFLLTQFPSLLLTLKIFGALYLFYLAYGLYKSGAAQEVGQLEGAFKSPLRLYTQGFFMSLLNPKVSLFFISFFPGFLFLPTQPIWLQFYALGGVFVTVSSLVFIGIALLASKIFSEGPSHKGFLKVLYWVQIILFVGIGIFLLLP